MAIKKTELYSSLWANCDELRGSIAAQVKSWLDPSLGPWLTVCQQSFSEIA